MFLKCKRKAETERLRLIMLRALIPLIIMETAKATFEVLPIQENCPDGVTFPAKAIQKRLLELDPDIEKHALASKRSETYLADVYLASTLTG